MSNGKAAKSASRGTRYGIGEVARLSSVPTSSIHHYMRLGLVPEPERIAVNRFAYDDRHVRALALIRTLRARGVPLEDIRDALPPLLEADESDVDAAVAAGLVGHEQRDAYTRLVDAAINAFATHGYGEVSIGDVCEQAGVAKATFYRHFDSKASLFRSAATIVVERAVVEFERAIASGQVTTHATAFARCLRPGLPVLFELAKQSIQGDCESTQAVASAVPLFVELVERIGRLVRGPDACSDQDAATSGGIVVMLALVEVFNGLIQAQAAAPGVAGLDAS
jgi:AcrR family transcriptional regulator